MRKVLFIAICLFFYGQSACAQNNTIDDGEYIFIDSLKNPLITIRGSSFTVTFASSIIFGRLAYKYKIKYSNDGSMTLSMVNKKMIKSGFKPKRLPNHHSANAENPNYDGDYTVISDVTGTLQLINPDRTIILVKED
jgi:hypothetical protein